MAKLHVILAGMSLIVAGGAKAAEPTFENHLQSAEMVSPAQDYQITDFRSDFAINYASLDGKNGDAENTNKGTDLFASAIYNIKAAGGLRAGVTADYMSLTTEMKPATGDKLTIDGSQVALAPQAAMPVGPVVLGAAYEYTQVSSKVSAGLPAGATADTKTNAYGTFKPGALFASNGVEAGLTYTSMTHITATDAKKADVTQPATVTAHGRYALDHNLAVGGIVTNVAYSGLDKDTQKDQQQVKATGEYTLAGVKMEGDLGYSTAFYKEKANMDSSNISTIGLGAAAEYGVSKAAMVGGALGYEFGNDKNADTKYTANNLTVAVRGNMKF